MSSKDDLISRHPQLHSLRRQQHIKAHSPDHQQLQEGSEVATDIVLRTHLDHKIKLLQLVLLLSIVFSTFSSIYLFRQLDKVNELTEQNLLQSYKIENINFEVDLYKKELSNINKLIDDSLERIKNQILKLNLKLEKDQNHNQALLELTRTEKKEISKDIQAVSLRINHSQSKYAKVITDLKQAIYPLSFVPKILWIYTQFDFKGEKMLEQLLSNFLVTKAQQSGYEVRYVNSLSAYEWLSMQSQLKITKAKRSMHIEHDIGDLLIMGILMEHGGVIGKSSQIFYIQRDFSWLEKHLRIGQTTDFKTYNQVLLFEEQRDPREPPEFQDYFLAAVKGATLINDTFHILCQTMINGKFQYSYLKEAVEKDPKTKALRVNNFISNTIRSTIEIMTPQYYDVEIIKTNLSLFLRPQCRDRLVEWLKRPDWEYNAQCGEPKHMIHLSEKDRPQIQNEVEAEIVNEALKADQYSYWHNWMMVPLNKKTIEPFSREITFCLLDAEPHSIAKNIQISFEKIKLQTYAQWTAVYALDQEPPEIRFYVEEQKKKGFNIKTFRHSGSLGRNYEMSIINHCPDKSHIVVLRRHEEFSDFGALQRLTGALAPRSVLGAFVGVNVSGAVFHTDTYMEWYNKLEFTAANPKYDIPDKILNYLRVFHSDCYKIIPQFQLRTIEGNYFNSRFAFLQQFLFMVRNLTQPHDLNQQPHIQKINWMMKSNAQLFDVPNRIVPFRDLVINTDRWQETDKNQIKRNSYKIDSYAMTYNMDHLIQNGIPFSDFAVFNPGKEFQSPTIRNKQEVIPKVIHLMQIEGKMPLTKQKIFQINKELYPDFTFKVWRQENITRQHFPMTFDAIQKILKIQKLSGQTKKKTLANLMLAEILYQEGGFHLETSMLLFNNALEWWLSYKLVMAADATFRHRWSKPIGFLGVMPKLPAFLRIISPSNLNRYDFWQSERSGKLGLLNFNELIKGNEQYDPDYLIMSFDSFYPVTFALPDQNDAYCWAEPHFLSKEDDIVLKAEGRYMVKNCGKYYPFSFGKKITRLENRWDPIN